MDGYGKHEMFVGPIPPQSDTNLGPQPMEYPAVEQPPFNREVASPQRTGMTGFDLFNGIRTGESAWPSRGEFAIGRDIDSGQ